MAEKAKRGRGQPKKIIDPEEIIHLRSIWCTVEEIADHFNCTRETLYANYSDALREGKTNAKCSLKRHMWKAAESGNVQMQIWLSKQHLGYKDRSPEEVPNTIINVNMNEQAN